MAEPEKSSDEILQELFGMCAVKKMIKAEPSSPKKNEDGNDDNDDISDSSKSSSHRKKHKHKKKRKKYKKEKKRKRSSSASVSESEDELSTTKKRKLRQGNESNDVNVSKNIVKIKIEKDAVKPLKGSVDEESEDRKNSNLMDLITGKRLTIDDVFTTLGILTDDKKPIKIKQEKLDPKYGDIVKTEKPESVNDVDIKPQLMSTNDGSKKSDEDPDTKKDQVTEVFECVRNNDDKSKSTSKKISIKNLKNSSVYEAAMKEVEKRAKERTEKYEEGELSSNTNDSDNDSWNNDHYSDQENKPKDDISKKESKSHRHKKKSKIRDSSSKTRSHSHSKKHKEKKSHRDRERYTRGSSIDRHKKKLSSTIDSHSRHSTSGHHRHSQEHDRYRRTVRSSSPSHRSSSLSKRSHRHWRSDNRRSSSKDSSRSQVKSTSIERIDKQKLLEIARKNAITLLKQGAIPASVIAHKDKIVSIRSGGKTVDELTDFCKKISRKEAEGLSTSEDGEEETDEEREKAFHHPFQIKERPSSIVMNIRNAVSLPTKTAQEKTLELSKQLSLQYPVSSGQQHRKTEGEWVPFVRSNETAIVPSNAPAVEAVASIDPTVNISYPAQTIHANATNAVVPFPQPVVAPPSSILPPQNNFDISNIVAQRLEAIRRLSENPKDPIGNNLILSADSKMQVWAESKIQPGLFTGSTGVRTLSAAELAAGCRASFPKKNQFRVAKPVYSDKGEALMKKMGWTPGEGLGKFKQGPSAPCEISVKMDRKGLAEQPLLTKNFKQPNTLLKAFEITQNKHPVSLLNEYCSRKKLPIPIYECQEREGASRRKLFLFSVLVNGVRYMPQAPSMNKKQSKIEAATICLQNLGLLPISPLNQPSS